MDMLDIWLMDDEKNHISRFFTGLSTMIANDDRLEAVNEIIFPMHEFQEREEASRSPQPRFDSLTDWNLDTNESEEQFILRRDTATDRKRRIRCHNLFFFYHWKKNYAEESHASFLEELDSFPSLRSSDPSTIIPDLTSLLSQSDVIRTGSNIFLSDIVWSTTDENKVSKPLKEFPGPRFLKNLSRETHEAPYNLFLLSQFLQNKHAEVYDAASLSGAIPLRKNNTLEISVRSGVDPTTFITSYAWKKILDDIVDHLYRDTNKTLTKRDAVTIDVNTIHDEYELIFQSDEFEEVIEKVAVKAITDKPVLIQGETGVGKSVLAKIIHDYSTRSSGPWVAVSLGDLNDDLIEAELFGSKKGAFTDAVDRKGFFEEAHGGTIFLDEIGTLPYHSQSALLNVLETGQISRVGSSDIINVDTRVIAATNDDLEEEVWAGNFRDDLYFRLSKTSLYIPPLRERPEDILPIFEHYMEVESDEYGISNFKLKNQAKNRLKTHEWKGNVREVESFAVQVLERIFISDNNEITLEDVENVITDLPRNYRNNEEQRRKRTGSEGKEGEDRIVSEIFNFAHEWSKLHIHNKVDASFEELARILHRYCLYRKYKYEDLDLTEICNANDWKTPEERSGNAKSNAESTLTKHFPSVIKDAENLDEAFDEILSEIS